MNIFVLDKIPATAARYHCDTHVVKMVLESAQILCSALHHHGRPAPYKPTHMRHPCVLWAAESKRNYEWLVHLGLALGREYTHRYDKMHKSNAVIWEIRDSFPEGFGPCVRTPFVQAMPEQYQGPDPVAAYRAYYMGDKSHLMAYTEREPPFWLTDPALSKK